MIKEGKIGIHEAIWITTVAISSKVFFSSPANLAGLVGNTGWYTTWISAGVALAGFLFICLLLKRFPGRDITDIFEKTLGRILGSVFSLIIASFIFFATFTRVSEFNDVMKIYVFPLSPAWLITGILVICVFTLSWLGFESIARVPLVLVYLMLASFFVVILLSMQNYRLSNIFPILGKGIGPSLLAGVQRSSAYGEVIILAIFAGSLQGIKNIRKEGVISILLSACLLSLSIFAFTLTFPYTTAEEVTAPMYEMATLVDYGRFLQGVEPVFLFIWILSTFMSVTIIFYSFVTMFCKVFRIQDRKPIVIAASIILFSSALMHKNIISVSLGNVETLRSYGSHVVFLLPIIVLIIAALKKKGDANRA